MKLTSRSRQTLILLLKVQTQKAQPLSATQNQVSPNHTYQDHQLSPTHIHRDLYSDAYIGTVKSSPNPAMYASLAYFISDFIPAPFVDTSLVSQVSQVYKEMWPVISLQAKATHPQFAQLYSLVRGYNLPNFLGAKRTVVSGLNLCQWEHELSQYYDRELCYFLRFGWPVGYHLPTPPASVSSNHHSANQHGEHIDHFIEVELQHQAIVGSFRKDPFTPWTRLSPLMTRPKKGSNNRRVLVDFSFPTGEAVNDGINITSIYGRHFSMILPAARAQNIKLSLRSKLFFT